MESLADVSFVGLLSFGAVAIADFFLRGNKDFTFGSKEKAITLVVFAFIFGFVPAEFGNAIAERIKDAVYVGASVTAIYTGGKNVLSRIGGK